MTNAEQTWAYIERLLTGECGLLPDQGLSNERGNCINAIKNGLPDAALLAAAIEFLSSGEGLHKIRVNGKMMTRKAGVTSRKLETGEELMVPYADLSEEAKELDRATVRTIYSAIYSTVHAI